MQAESIEKQLLAKRMTYTQSLNVSPSLNVKVSIESAIGQSGIIAVAWFKKL